MARKSGDTHLGLVYRRDQVKQLLINRARLSEMATALKVSEDTISRDIEAIMDEWRSIVDIKALWNHKEAFDFLDEYDRMLMTVYHQKPRQIKMGRDVVPEDRSFLKIHTVKALVHNLQVRNIMAGIGTVKIFEQLRYLQSEKARGYEMTRIIGYEDMKKAGVERLRNDLELQRREGLITDEPITTT